MAWRASLSKTVQELRIHLCQTSPSSKGVRDFVAHRYQELKNQNPQLPILIRECSGVQPRLFARFDYGKEKAVGLDGLDEAAVESKLEELVKTKPQ
ncbi:NADH dehydrogenase (ubiquinone) 1 alpha subcomplex 2 [Klebsormidium nitens]|uniref:NADH dehydrogenase (Ubiquinone) 1 alpha subcomplex 2 n=1 Tax=Klebsormidium nitens TaxID=105231 RepID=A0A1Y1I0S3_KLENI|nr:NADH dehydrogenase (ubiquinone) 1 alpha subcomplex 2 [Klebsormidium nitens]|eukprot:GAQ81698.1 NADH dehydrogenase (ubiquinone) 1 alpha subcomplex 2 [Klebsormidium nitens]